jgi:hypothetical protein
MYHSRHGEGYNFENSEEIGGWNEEKGSAGRRKLNKSREIFHVIVCVSVTASSHVISHESFRDYFLELVVPR